MKVQANPKELDITEKIFHTADSFAVYTSFPPFLTFGGICFF